MEFNFKIETNVEERKKEYIKMKNNFPEKIPVICERDPKSNLIDIDKNKYLVPDDFAVSQLNEMLRKRVIFNSYEPFYLLFNGKDCVTGDKILREIYEKYKDSQDGFLYIGYTDDLTYI